VYGGGWRSFDEALENRIGRWCVTQDKRGMPKWSMYEMRTKSSTV